MRSTIKQNKDWKETQTAMVPMIVKKVNDIKLEALFATCLSCAKYTIDNLNQTSGSNDVLFNPNDIDSYTNKVIEIISNKDYYQTLIK